MNGFVMTREPVIDAILHRSGAVANLGPSHIRSNGRREGWAYSTHHDIHVRARSHWPDPWHDELEGRPPVTSDQLAALTLAEEVLRALRYSRAADTNSRKSGCGLLGLLLNSGWNWQATK